MNSGPACKVFRVIADKIHSEIPPSGIPEVLGARSRRSSTKSIWADEYVMPPVGDATRYIDLSQIDFEALREKFVLEKLVLDWRKQQTTRAMVFTTIQGVLDQLPRSYSPEVCK
ncbi:MAG TPA: hypothetical protein VKU01_32500 [Bryobacteraceae bacterium]|nr:hypothetical protein [Bryobacteraceae bacterium]